MAVAATLTLMVGVCMAVLGLLRAGSIMNFVSNAVMTGFTAGIALQIIAGSLKDATGYDPDSENTIGKIIDWAIHAGDWLAPTTAVAVLTVVVWALAHMALPIRHYAILIALVVATAVAAVIDPHTELVNDIAEIPNSLPRPVLPDLSAAPHLVVGALAVTFVALAQAAGISAAVPNPDGSRADASRDFLAQGVANLGGAVTQALPTGGSLSRTGVAVSAGSRTRLAGVIAGISMALIVLLLGNAVGLIPMAVIGGLMIIVGLEILIGRWPDIMLVWRTSPGPAAAMVSPSWPPPPCPCSRPSSLAWCSPWSCSGFAPPGPAGWSHLSRKVRAGSGRRPFPASYPTTACSCCTTRAPACSPRCRSWRTSGPASRACRPRS